MTKPQQLTKRKWEGCELRTTDKKGQDKKTFSHFCFLFSSLTEGSGSFV